MGILKKLSGHLYFCGFFFVCLLAGDQRRSRTNAVVTDAAVGRSWRPEDLARVTVLELDDLVVDLDVTDSRWRSLSSRDVPIGSFCKKGNNDNRL